MDEKRTDEINCNKVSVWLARARENASRCFLCNRIAQAHSGAPGDLQSIRISGVEMTAETQIAHLSRCVGGEGPLPESAQGL